MTFVIACTKDVDPSGTHHTYRDVGVGKDFDLFCEWLREKFHVTMVGCSLSQGWRFTNPNDDVEIRLMWSERFIQPEGSKY